MATLTRGYSFGSNEVASASKLHKLIDNAGITGLTVDDFTGDLHGITQTAPVSPTTGDVWTEFQVPTFESSTYSGVFSEHLFVIQSDEYAGKVVIFSPHGTMETRRFVGSGDSGGTYEDGIPVLSDATNGYTLVAWGFNAGAEIKHAMIGSSREDTVTDQSARVAIIGFAESKLKGAAASANQPYTTFNRGTNDLDWMFSTGTSQLSVFGYRLTDFVDPASDRLRLPTWLLGGPIYRID